MQRQSEVKTKLILIMYGRYYNNYNDDDDDDDDYYDSYCYGQVEESPKKEEQLSINDLNEDEMEGNFRSLESCWFITINSPKKQYKLAVMNIVSVALLKETITKDGYTRTEYNGLEFITTAGTFVCKGMQRAMEEYRFLSDNFKDWVLFRTIGCESIEFVPLSDMHRSNPDNDNHSNQLNPNNAEYNHCRDKN